MGQYLGLADQSPTTLARTLIGSLERLSSGAHPSTAIQDASFPGSAADLERSVIGVLKLADHELGGKFASAGTVVFPTSDAGRSFLHLAASLGFHTLVGELLRRGFDLDKRDENGYTAFDYSIFYGHPICSELLVQAGAEIVGAQDVAVRAVARQARCDIIDEAKVDKEHTGSLDTLGPAGSFNGDPSDIEASGASDAVDCVTSRDSSPARATSSSQTLLG